MQPTLCSRCKKNPAMVFISKLEGDKTTNEGLCLQCARKIGLPQVDEMMKRMGISEEDLEILNADMMAAAQDMSGPEEEPDEDEDDEEEEQGHTATFPFMNRLFNSERNAPPPPPPPQNNRKDGKARASKHKFLDNYCICLTERAKEGKLDPVIGREEEIERVV